MNNYINEHRETTKRIYKYLNEKLITGKEKTINYHNKHRHDPFDYQENSEAYRKNFTKIH